MNLDDVAVFVEAVQAGSLAGAARQLEIAPMAASRRLAALESELGVRLMHRTTRALSLTPEGEAFLPHAQVMLESGADGLAAIRPENGEAAGLLRVTTSVPFGRKVVMGMMAGFMRAHPKLRVDLLLSDSAVDIVAQGIDLAVRIMPLRDSTLVARKLGDSPRSLYASPDYLRARPAPTTLAELSCHDGLTVSGATHWTFESNGRLTRQKINCRFSANSMDALHQACLDGLGIMMMADWNAAVDMAAGRLVPLPLVDARSEWRGIWAIYPTARQVPPKVRLFVEALQTHLGRMQAVQ